MIAAGSPWPPATAGKGNQPRSGSGFWSGVREAITPGSQAPISSMLALWFATRPAELSRALLRGGGQEALVERACVSANA